MPHLLKPTEVEQAEGHGDEVLAVCYSPDSHYVVSGGFDGMLRLWNAGDNSLFQKYPVSNKAVTACAVSPDGKYLLSGSLDGMLAQWDAASGAAANGIRGEPQTTMFLAHTRPISAIEFGSDSLTIVTASWDSHLTLWRPLSEGRTMSGHGDIVTGCRITPDGRFLVSWSYDHTARLWDLSMTRQIVTFEGHQDRILTGDVSPDGRWAVTGSRDGDVILWDIVRHEEQGGIQLEDQVAATLFLRDGKHLVVAQAGGAVGLFSVPDLELLQAIEIDQSVHCGALSPAGSQLALGCGDGIVRIVPIEEFDAQPLLIRVSQSSKRMSSGLQKLFGRSREVTTYIGTCPACQALFEIPAEQDSSIEQIPCPGCKRQLRIAAVTQPLPD
ncbi:MAG: hypothetical protein KatS3mg105_1418 [Gemmatales bacterium]|nr:MAG: hypothetical protein KatS3mg105_1418 [Gemmatales bacterium]